MAARIIWSPEAADDLEQIVEYIARGSARYGAQVASDVLEAIERIAQFPRSGPSVPELDDPDVRQVLVYSYRVIYRVHTDAVRVAAIVHGARDLSRALGNRTI
jgi:toxin ParE1/3/4